MSCRQRVILIAWRACGKSSRADIGGLQSAGLGTAVPGVAGDAAGRDLPPGQGPDLGTQQRAEGYHSLSGEGLGQADAVAGGLADVRVMHQPVHHTGNRG